MQASSELTCKTALLGGNRSASPANTASASASSSGPSISPALLLKVLLALGVFVVAPAAFSHWSEAREFLYTLEEHVEAEGLWGIFLAWGCLVVWALLLLPTSIFEVAVGYAFGFQRALWITWAGKTLGGVLAFLLGRTFFRDWAGNVLQAHPLSRALKMAINDKIVTVVFLVRAAYIPMAVKNYGLSVCPGVSLTTFTFVSALVNIPYSLMWSWWGSELQSDRDINHLTQQTFSAMHITTLAFAVCASVLLIILSCHWTAQLYAQMELEPLEQQPCLA